MPFVWGRRTRIALARIGTALRRGAWFVGFLALTSCSTAFGSREEVAISLAPDRVVLAVLSQTNRMTIPYAYAVDLYGPVEDRRGPVHAATIYGARRSDCAAGVDLTWRDATTLVMRYKTAWLAVVPDVAQVGGRRIRLIAQAGRANPQAPCGAMKPLPLP